VESILGKKQQEKMDGELEMVDYLYKTRFMSIWRKQLKIGAFGEHPEMTDIYLTHKQLTERNKNTNRINN